MIVLDNYSVHKIQKLLNIYPKNRINILFNTPYNSKWNSVELDFRNLKSHLYTKINGNLDSTLNEAKSFMETESFINCLKGNFLKNFAKI